MKPDALAISSGHIIQRNATTPIAYAFNLVPLGCTFSSTPKRNNRHIQPRGKKRRLTYTPVLRMFNYLVICLGGNVIFYMVAITKNPNGEGKQNNHEEHQALACSAILNAYIEEDVQ